MADDYANTIAELKNSVENIREATASRIVPVKSCFPVSYIIAIFIPIIILAVLLLTSPSFVQKKDGRKYVRSGWKVTLWTIILTFVAYLGMYLFTFCRNYKQKLFCYS